MTCSIIMLRRLPGFPLFPYTSLFRSVDIDDRGRVVVTHDRRGHPAREAREIGQHLRAAAAVAAGDGGDRKSTRLNSSHTVISYAVFCLKKKRSPARR